MVDSNKNIEYVPGFYEEKKPRVADLADRYIREWDEEQQKMEKEDIQPEKLFPTICFSRIIGVGAVEIADILAKKIGYRVVDRQILEHITNEIKLSNITTRDRADALIDILVNKNLAEFFFKRLSNNLCSPSRLVDIVEIDHHIEFTRNDTLFAINMFKK